MARIIARPTAEQCRRAYLNGLILGLPLLKLFPREFVSSTLVLPASLLFFTALIKLRNSV